MDKKKIFKRGWFEAILVVVLMFLLLGVALPQIRNVFYKAVSLTLTPGKNATAVIHHITAGKLEFSTSEAAIGDLEIIGVNQVYTLNLGTSLVDGFVPASADSDAGYGIPIDFILDSLRFTSSDEAAGDSAIFTTYRTTATAVIISGPDTLTGNGIVNYTAIAAASRDLDASADEKFSIFVDVKGTYTDALLQIFGRSYDVR